MTMFNVNQCPYKIYYYCNPFDFGYRCSKRQIFLKCPTEFTSGQGIPLGCPRIEITTDSQTSVINKDDNNV